LALAVSGVLGPEPDEDGNPVGLVFFGCCRRNAKPTIVRRDYGKQSAEWLRRRVVLDALDLAQRCSTLPKEAVYASGQTP
jgi:nicotinamide mononucleotide (NMN) deamidase PncC